MSQLYILYENACGFSVFRTTEFEEVAVFLPQVRESILNISKFRSNVLFVTFQPFKDQKNALHNMQSITSGELSNDLKLFLENNIPRTMKSKQPVVLGVEDPDLAAVISDNLDIKCLSSGLVIEIIRGIRFHFYKLLKGFVDENLGTKSQLALAHHYSRVKLNFDATRQDCMIIQSNSFVDQLEKDINTLGKRIREWHTFHFPELFKLLPNDIELFVQCVNVIGDRKNMPEDVEEKLNAILGDSNIVETILLSAHNSMGTDIASIDLINLKMLCDRIISLINRRKSTITYLKSKMNHTAPNVSSLLGEMIGSRLISRAGGLEKLAKLPSSTVQVLGAEKKFFRSLKDRKEKVPVSGLLSNSAFMGKAGRKKKGRLAKVLANKCSLAARVDCFSKTRKETFGGQLIQEVENSMKYAKKVKIQDNSKATSEEMVSGKEESYSEKATKSKELKDVSNINSVDDPVEGSSTNDMFDLEGDGDSSNRVVAVEESITKRKAAETESNAEVSNNPESLDLVENSNEKLSNYEADNGDESSGICNGASGINPSKKRKSRNARSAFGAQGMDEEASKMHVDDAKKRTPLKKRMSLRKKKSS